MPKRTDINSILIIGAGPIVIGQACEFDYSGAQACTALKAMGYRVILVNSNPATIMTDPDMADATYIEPIEWQTVEQIIIAEKPDALLPTMGGQTALNCALDCVREGVLDRHGVQLIGASQEAIHRAEDREAFGQLMRQIGLETPKSGLAHSMEQAWAVLDQVGFPAIIRPSFTMGGTGGGIAYNREEFQEICERGLALSPSCQLLIDESIIGWKEYECEVVRDCADNCIIVCTIENLDPMGIHTGDSITVAPAQTLTDKEFQRMRNASFAILRAIGVETGGANVQFAVNPVDGRMVVIEMNPRVSRSSALASKATGFPIAKVAAQCAVGLTLNEMTNDITQGQIPASFEPTIDYVVTKIPRFNFEKFPTSDCRLSTQMKSVGEVMALGRTFQESIQKALSGLEIGLTGFDERVDCANPSARSIILRECRNAGPERILYVADAFRYGKDVEDVFALTQIDRWFLRQIEEIVQLENRIQSSVMEQLTSSDWRLLKQKGFSDARLARLMQCSERSVRAARIEKQVLPTYKRVDTCAGEFSTSTAYLYSCYEQEDEAQPSCRKKIIILGGGPNRIGQGIEFDYCCVHASLALRAAGYETIMVNCNPETVSTDYDVSDRLYFEPLSCEKVLDIIDVEQPEGVLVQFGGQTPLKLVKHLTQYGVSIIGTPPDAIDRAESRERFQQLLQQLSIKQPPNGTVRSIEEGKRLAKVFAYPLIVRPSYVLGGRAMAIIHNETELSRYLMDAPHISNEEPLLLDHFLSDAIEVDVDAICDGSSVYIAGILEHIEEAGIHSGDSSCILPPHSLSEEIQDTLSELMTKMALELGVVGLINAQFAIKDGEIYVIEVNPRASRTIPFIAKVTGAAIAGYAARVMTGCKLTSLELPNWRNELGEYAVKKPVFPFNKFQGSDPILGPEMRSTGEVMGIASSYGAAFAKAQLGAGEQIPRAGMAFISVRDPDKQKIIPIAESLSAHGFTLVATNGTAAVINHAGIACQAVNKVEQGRPHIVDMIKNGDIQLIINTTSGEKAIADSVVIRRCAIVHQVPITTTISGAEAICSALKDPVTLTVSRLQQLHIRRRHAKNTHDTPGETAASA